MLACAVCQSFLLEGSTRRCSASGVFASPELRSLHARVSSDSRAWRASESEELVDDLSCCLVCSEGLLSKGDLATLLPQVICSGRLSPFFLLRCLGLQREEGPLPARANHWRRALTVERRRRKGVRTRCAARGTESHLSQCVPALSWEKGACFFEPELPRSPVSEQRPRSSFALVAEPVRSGSVYGASTASGEPRLFSL